MSDSAPETTLNDILATPLVKLQPTRSRTTSLSGASSHGPKQAHEVTTRPALEAIHTLKSSFDGHVQDFMDCYIIDRPAFMLPDEAAELNEPPTGLRQRLRSITPVEHTRVGVECVLTAARAILTTIFRTPFLRQTYKGIALADCEPFSTAALPPVPAEGEEAPLSVQDGEVARDEGENEEDASSSQFQWDLHSADFGDPTQKVAVMSWSSGPVTSSNLETADADHQDVDCRVLFFTLGAREFSDADFRAFTETPASSVAANRVDATSEATRLWGQISDRCHETRCHWFVVTTHENWSFGTFSEGWTSAYISMPIPYNSSPSTTDTSSVIQCVIYWILSAMDHHGGWYEDQVDSAQEASSNADLEATRSHETWMKEQQEIKRNIKELKAKRKQIGEERLQIQREMEKARYEDYLREKSLTGSGSGNTPKSSGPSTSSTPAPMAPPAVPSHALAPLASTSAVSSSASLPQSTPESSPNKRKRSSDETETDVDLHQTLALLHPAIASAGPIRPPARPETSSPSPRKKHRLSQISIPPKPEPFNALPGGMLPGEAMLYGGGSLITPSPTGAVVGFPLGRTVHLESGKATSRKRYAPDGFDDGMGREGDEPQKRPRTSPKKSSNPGSRSGSPNPRPSTSLALRDKEQPLQISNGAASGSQASSSRLDSTSPTTDSQSLPSEVLVSGNAVWIRKPSFTLTGFFGGAKISSLVSSMRGSPSPSSVPLLTDTESAKSEVHAKVNTDGKAGAEGDVSSDASPLA